jgi:hypothetical protein
MRFINFTNIMSLTETKNILYLVIFILLLVLFLKMYNESIESIENFWVYGTSTRLCNNRGCEVPRTAQSITYTPTSVNDIVAHNSN